MILVIVGESASGKSTLAKQFVEDNPSFSRIVTYTTRPKREGEVDGIDYHFVSDEVFESMINNNMFVEHADYRGWHYGTAVNFGKDEDKIVVLTPAGARAFRRYKELNPELDLDIYVVYLQVDRRSRLIKMLQRGDDIDECCRRSLSDVGQFDSFEDEANCVINNDRYEMEANILSSTISDCIYQHKAVIESANKIIDEIEKEEISQTKNNCYKNIY